MTKLDELLKEIEESIAHANRIEYIAVWIDKESCVGSDWDLMHAETWKSFNNKSEAEEYIKDKGFKGRPFYWQPRVHEKKHNDTPVNASNYIPRLTSALRRAVALLETFAERNDLFDFVDSGMYGECAMALADIEKIMGDSSESEGGEE